jgi:recombination protein RecA
MPTVDDLVSKSVRKWGVGVVNKGETLPKDYPRIPTGIYSVDYSLGGGFPVGVASCLYGPPGGGKSLVLQKAIGCAQQLCWKCFEYKWDCTCSGSPLEQKVIAVTTEVFDPEWATCLGVDLENIIIVEPEYGEQAADIISEALRSTDCGLVCLDSVAMLTPMAELDASFEDAMVASQARLISRMMRVVESRLMREKKLGHKVAFLATNHIRSKIGQMFGNPEDVPGGWAAKHTWHLTLRMSQLATESGNKDGDGVPVNAKFKASTVALSNKRKIFMLQGAAEFYCTMKDQGEFIAGDIPDFKTVEKAADEIEFIGRSPWSCNGKEYDKKADLIADWHEKTWYLSVKKKLVDEYRNIAKMEMGMS